MPQLESDGSLWPVNRSTAVPPSMSRTWPITLVKFLYGKIRGGSSSEGSKEDGAVVDESEDGTLSDVAGSGTVTPKEDDAPGMKAGRVAATIAGGRRRKAVRKR